jgi:hypothetical protein
MALCHTMAFKNDVSGEHIVRWYQKLFTGATTFASILASIMFSVVVLDLHTTDFPKGTDCECDVRTWAAAGAIMFVLLVLECQGCSLALNFHGRALARRYDSKEIFVRLMFAVVSLLFQELLLTGTLFFCLVVKAYVPAVGWSAFGVTSALMAASLGAWTFSLCIEFRSQWKKWRGEPWVTAEQAVEDENEADRRAVADARHKSRGMHGQDRGP